MAHQVTKETFTLSPLANNWPDLSVVPGLDPEDVERLRLFEINSTKFLFDKFEECRQQYTPDDCESKFRTLLLKHEITKKHDKAVKVCQAIVEWHENTKKNNNTVSKLTNLCPLNKKPQVTGWPNLTTVSGINRADSNILKSKGINNTGKLCEKLRYFRSTKGCDYQRYFCQWYLEQINRDASTPRDFRDALRVCDALEERSTKPSFLASLFLSKNLSSPADCPNLTSVQGISEIDGAQLIAAGIFTPRQLIDKLTEFYKLQGCDYRRHFCQWYLQLIGKQATSSKDFRYALTVCNELSDTSEKLPINIDFYEISYIKVAMHWPDLTIMREISEEEGEKLYMAGIYTPHQLFNKLKYFYKFSSRDFRLLFCQWYLQQLEKPAPSPNDFRRVLVVCKVLEECEIRLSAAKWFNCFPISKKLSLIIDWPDLMVVHGIDEEDGTKLIANGIFTPRQLIDQLLRIRSSHSSESDFRTSFCQWYLLTLEKNFGNQNDFHQALKVCVELERLNAEKCIFHSA